MIFNYITMEFTEQQYSYGHDDHVYYEDQDQEILGLTDCLVLKITEFEYDTGKKDASVYILYDVNSRSFIIRGKRRSTKTTKSCCFSFSCKHVKDVANFLSFVICEQNLWTYVLYNYDNLPATSDEITFDFLKRNQSSDYELAGYNKMLYDKDLLLKNLRMLRSVFNLYN